MAVSFHSLWQDLPCYPAAKRSRNFLKFGPQGPGKLSPANPAHKRLPGRANETYWST